MACRYFADITSFRRYYFRLRYMARLCHAARRRFDTMRDYALRAKSAMLCAMLPRAIRDAMREVIITFMFEACLLRRRAQMLRYGALR